MRVILFLFGLIACSEPIAIQPPQCSGSSKSAERDEPEPPPDKRASSKSVFISKDAASPHEKVKQSFSSTCFYSSYCLILGIFRFYNHKSVWLNHLTHWTDGSAVSSACCCWLRPRFDGSQPSINPFSGILFWTSWIWDTHVHIHTGKKLIHTK